MRSAQFKYVILAAHDCASVLIFLILIFNVAGCSQLEIERLYNIALNGSEEEKTTAAKILCGASLASGWNVQVKH